MVRLLHLADLHLGWEPRYLSGEKRKKRRKERDQLLERAVDVALSPENNIHGVIIVGDLFEKYKPDDALIRETISQINRLVEAGKLAVTIPGNHDEITYRESVYRIKRVDWPGSLITNPMPEHCVTEIVQGMPVHIYSLAYTGGITKPGDIEAFPRTSEPGLHIGAFHGSLDWEGLADRSLPLSSRTLSTANYNYIALGHYHQFSEKNIASGKAVYPGAVEFKSFHDMGTGYFTVMEWTGSDIKLEKIPDKTRPYEKLSIDISNTPDFEGLKELCLKKKDKEKMIQITLAGTPKFHINTERLLDELEDSYFYVEIENKAQYFSEEFLDSVAKETTVRGLYVKRIREKLENTEDEVEQRVLRQALLEGLAVLEGSES